MPMAAMDMPAGAGFQLLRFLMWFLMMTAMMTPSNLPAVLLFQRVARQASSPLARTLLFAGGYVVAWGIFSAAATALQAVMDRARLVDVAGAPAGNPHGGGPAPGGRYLPAEFLAAAAIVVVLRLA